MFGTMLACILAGFVLSLPIIRANRRTDARGLLVRRGDYLRTRRRGRLGRVAANTFGMPS